MLQNCKKKKKKNQAYVVQFCTYEFLLFQGNYDNETSPSSKGPSFRSPSALLQISLSNPDILDELEEDVYGAFNGDGENQEEGGTGDDMKPSLQSFRDHRPHSVDSSFRSRRGSADMDQARREEQMKLEEIARIQANGPYLEPGLINHVCVVGPRGTGGARIDLTTKGWIGRFPFLLLHEFKLHLVFLKMHFILMLYLLIYEKNLNKNRVFWSNSHQRDFIIQTEGKGKITCILG